MTVLPQASPMLINQSHVGFRALGFHIIPMRYFAAVPPQIQNAALSRGISSNRRDPDTAFCAKLSIPLITVTSFQGDKGLDQIFFQ
mmetsp:Transcript_4892/g.9887  ORF Transcript_4892/g.9887 Transcript_4892/m.9887 type:complete len:86 (-) Transcript_4892:528-785(-)